MRALAPILVIVLVCAGTSQATTYFVAPDGSGDYPTIAAAISACVNGDIISLGDGTFEGDGNRDLTFMGLEITVRSQSGNAELCRIHPYEGGADFHRAFNFHSGEGPIARIEYVTIAQGRESYGGAIQCISGSSPTILGCIFEENTAAISGGAIYCSSASPDILFCRFVSNSAAVKGGAICGLSITASIISSVFEGNSSSSEGGAISMSGSVVTISNCHFTGSESEDGGAIHMVSNPELTWILDCAFGSNTTSGSGAAFYMRDVVVNCTNCTFDGNVAGREGGGIYLRGGSLACQGTEFSNNIAAGGGGINNSTGALTLQGCLFVGNGNSWGAGVRGFRVQPGTISECTFIGNVADVGGGVLIEDDDSREQIIQNCTFYANDAPEAIRFEDRVPLVLSNSVIHHPSIITAVFVENALDAQITCCDITDEELSGQWPWNLGGFLGNEGNISADPLFCDPANGDLMLHCTSPCATDPECGLMGAWPVGCGGTPVESATWGQIKAIYR